MTTDSNQTTPRPAWAMEAAHDIASHGITLDYVHEMESQTPIDPVALRTAYEDWVADIILAACPVALNAELRTACELALIRLDGNTGVGVLSQQETADIVRAALAKVNA